MANNRVVFVCEINWRGGANTWMRRTSATLPQFGWDCTLVLPGYTGLPRGDWKDWPCPVRETPPSYSYATLTRRLARVIAAERPNVIVGTAAHTIPQAVRYLYRSSACHARFMDTIVADYAVEYPRLRGNADIIASVGAISCDCVELVRKRVPELASKVFRFYTPIPSPDVPPRPRPSGPLRLVCVSRLVGLYKRILDFVPLVKRLSAAQVNFTLDLIGDGSERAELHRRIAAIPGVDGRVRFHGWLSNDEVLHRLPDFDVYVLLSDAEGLPLAVLEAMAQGVVPVVTDLEGYKDVIVHGENGVLLPIGDITAFADTLAALAQDRSRLNHISRAAWQAVRNQHSVEKSVSEFASLLEYTSAEPLPSKSTLRPITYPKGLMARIGVPEVVQELKRWALRQEVY